MTTTKHATRDAIDCMSERFHVAGSVGDVETSREAGPSIHDQAFTPDRGGEPTGTVALLLDHRNASWVAIRRAIAMSDALDAKLHVVLAIPTRTATRHPFLITSNVSELLKGKPPRRGYDLEVIEGPIDEVGFESARDEDACVVIVDAHVGARSACRLADKLGVPVLVARDARDSGDWVAASDMRHLNYPVLSTARNLARCCERDVVYFHNARPIPVFIGDPMASAASYTGILAAQDDAVAAKYSRLESLAANDSSLHGFVARSGNTIEAVLDLARDRDADMVIVGHHRRSWLARMLGRGTAEQIVKRSRRSVLIVPLDRNR